MIKPGEEMITVQEAANILGITKRGVNAAIERGAIEAQKFGAQYAVSKRSVLEYKENRGPGPGRSKSSEDSIEDESS